MRQGPVFRPSIPEGGCVIKVLGCGGAERCATGAEHYGVKMMELLRDEVEEIYNSTIDRTGVQSSYIWTLRPT
jgi:hypothetical protein